ncbi:MAG: NUDIX hydrolase [Microthrixaceae bacterium]
MEIDVHPGTTQVVCSNIVLNEQGLLLVREAKPSALGRWSLPAGRLETGESLREGAAREALEETGLTVDVGPLLGIYHCPSTLEGGSAINFVFRSTVLGGEIRTTAKHPEVAFVSRAAVDLLVAQHQIRGQHVRHALAAADAGQDLPAGLVVGVEASPLPTPGTSADAQH